jgi:hypothetical protein
MYLLATEKARSFESNAVSLPTKVSSGQNAGLIEALDLLREPWGWGKSRAANPGTRSY